jgi:hypothetical protein
MQRKEAIIGFDPLTCCFYCLHCKRQYDSTSEAADCTRTHRQEGPTEYANTEVLYDTKPI